MVLDWTKFGETLTVEMVLYRMMAAVILGAIIGIDREVKNRPAGMRTYVLVCVGATLIALVEQQTIYYVSHLGNQQITMSIGRITATIVSGVSFLGAGTIVRSERKIKGLTTAASLWCTACLGVAIGAGYVTMALIAGIIVIVVLKFLQKVIPINTYKKLEVQFIHRTETLNYLNHYFEEMNVAILDVDFHAEVVKTGNTIYTNIYSLSLKDKKGYTEIIGALSEYPNVMAVRTTNV